MKHKLYFLLLTALLGIWRTQAWAQDLSTTEIDGVAYYEINDVADLKAFADLVNAGQFGSNAVLTADIDMAELSADDWTAIGDWGGISGTASACYRGHFNGQGHTITGFNATSIHNYYGIFGVISTGALIENFTIYGTLTLDHKTGGVVGYARDATPTLRNIHSYLNISCTIDGIRPGGILGSSVNGTIVVENCIYSGNLDAGGHTGNIGGIVGYVNNNAAAILNITNCIFDGTIQNGEEADGQCGGIIGYNNGGKVTIKNCLSIGAITASSGNIGQFFGRLNGGNSAFDNNYYVGDFDNGTTGAGTASGPAPVKVTAEQLASGEVCYLLNGDQTSIAFYQNLPGDERPTLDATHAQVYMIGRLHCNGTPYEGSSYSNENAAVTQDDHNIVDGFCTYCGLFDKNYLTPNASGFYELANEKQLKWFEQMVNGGAFDANAILTADIVFTSSWEKPIGTTETTAFKGIFDGQGHKITDFDVTSSGTGGLFGCTNGATIQNFSIAGTMTATAGTGSGVVGWPANSYISNIHSTLDIAVPNSGVHHVGGVVGSARGGNYIDGCSFSGSMTVAAGSTDNFAGVVAYLGGDSVANCANYGTITFSDAGCAAGGVAGYLNNTTSYVRNCLNIGEVICDVSSSPKYGGAIIGRIKNNWSSSRVVNNYWLKGTAYGPARKDDGTSPATASAEGTPSDVMGSGEIAWKLNGETFLDVVWHQTLNENLYPMLDSSEAIVYQTASGYDCVSEDNPDSFSGFISTIIANEQNFIEDLIAYQPLLEQYKETIESWNDIDTYASFIAAYKAAVELKESIQKSVTSYENYRKACEYAITYLKENDVEGTWSDFLKTYLEENIEPGTDYPNGSYSYVVMNCALDDEAIAAEIAFVNQMLENAIAGGLTAGTEVTRLMANSNFADGLEGWTTENDEGVALAHGGMTEIMTIARGLGKGAFNIFQTLNELPNGIYLMSVNGLFRASADITNQFYAGQLYLNGTANYFMSPGEDFISADEAEPGVNCLGAEGDAEYEADGIVGFVPKSLSGCSYAYGAGRYQNFVATEVTDGNLTVGVRSLATGMSNDWLPFGNVRVYYLGSEDEANKKLTEVLEGYKARAEIILNFQWSEYEDYAQFPNMSEQLKDQLAVAIEEADGAAVGAEKMELIKKFSALFNEVHACRTAYIAMRAAVDKMQDAIDALSSAGLIDDDTFDEWTEKIYAVTDHYLLGDVSAEEAMAIAEELNSVNLVPIPTSEDGVYELATAEHARIFSILVSSGNKTAKAVLTADIDMCELDADNDFEPIGTSTNPFEGEFDGQGHKITNFGQYEYAEGGGSYTLQLSGDAQGFIGYASGATIKNFSIEGAFEYYGGTGVGAVGWATNSQLINIHSALDIAVPEVSHHIGGVCGHLSENSSATNCSFSGTITETAGSHDCIGGIGAYSNNGVSYTNCANYGTIIYSAANAYAGGICGYVNNNSFTGIFNCINTGEVKMANGTPTYGGAFVGRLRSHSGSKFENNYMLEDSAPSTSGENVISASTVTGEQLASGEVCYKLNGDQEEINWYQTLGEDTYPVLFDTHKVVYMVAEGTYSNEKTTTPDGSKENPFVVKSAADLANLLNLLVSGRMNYVVMEADVDMAGVTDWTPLYDIPDQSNGYPYIDFDGKGHVIKNLTSNRSGAYAYCGVFGVLCGNVRNLGIENATVECEGGTGIIAGYLGHSSYGQPCYIENVWVTGKLTANGYCGGMFGNIADEAHILNCYANVEVTGSGDLTGGIIGRVRNRVEMVQVYAAGSINRGGGIIGGGFQDATPLGTYKHVAVWNNTEKNFGPVRENEDLRMIIFYDGTNFADMQSQVVAWDPEVWFCNMEPFSYPVLKAFAATGDVNNDGKIDISDAVTVLNAMAGQQVPGNADVNGDGLLDIADFVKVLNIMAGQ